MKYLDDRIIFHLDAHDGDLPYTPEEGVNRFEIYRYNVFNSSSGYKQLVFVGNLYHDGGMDEDVDISDIVRSLKEVPDSNDIQNATNWNTTLTLQDRFKVKWYTKYNGTEQTPLESDWLTVSMIYRYPNYRNNFSDGDNVFFDTFDMEDGMRTCLQGVERYTSWHQIYRWRYLLLPHYPLKATDNGKFIQAFIAESGTTDMSIEVMGTDSGHYYNTFDITYSPYKKGSLYISSITNLVGTGNTISEIAEDLEVYDSASRRIGVLDNCYKRYYLMWQDRFGGFQSQAFNEYATYSETFETVEAQNYRNERKKINIQIQPKWKINSGWITEELFPLYESIYISPILYLYDTKEDRLHEVIIKGDYVEKTYRSEKRMLNLNLELELNTKQNIIY